MAQTTANNKAIDPRRRRRRRLASYSLPLRKWSCQPRGETPFHTASHEALQASCSPGFPHEQTIRKNSPPGGGLQLHAGRHSTTTGQAGLTCVSELCNNVRKATGGGEGCFPSAAEAGPRLASDSRALPPGAINVRHSWQRRRDCGRRRGWGGVGGRPACLPWGKANRCGCGCGGVRLPARRRAGFVLCSSCCCCCWGLPWQWLQARRRRGEARGWGWGAARGEAEGAPAKAPGRQADRPGAAVAPSCVWGLPTCLARRRAGPG